MIFNNKEVIDRVITNISGKNKDFGWLQYRSILKKYRLTFSFAIITFKENNLKTTLLLNLHVLTL